MIRLHSTVAHYCVRAVLLCISNQVFQLAGFIASGGKAAAVILNPNFWSTSSALSRVSGSKGVGQCPSGTSGWAASQSGALKLFTAATILSLRKGGLRAVVS